MNVLDYARSVLFGESLEDKLNDPRCVTDFSGNISKINFDQIFPGRDNKIQFSSDQLKFPKKGGLKLKEKRGLALHFFANHELLAIEIMCAAILYLDVPKEDEFKIRKGLLATIKDEQKHFLLYQNRMKDFAKEFGSYPINDFFWRQFQKINTFSEYLAMMALTFEGANLDFAKYYSEVFREIGDLETARIMDIVYRDEITHVAFGGHWFSKWRQNQTVWEYFVDNLPSFVSPARAKGIIFDREGREKAGLDKDFIDQLENYRDDFKVTNRKQWK